MLYGVPSCALPGDAAAAWRSRWLRGFRNLRWWTFGLRDREVGGRLAGGLLVLARAVCSASCLPGSLAGALGALALSCRGGAFSFRRPAVPLGPGAAASCGAGGAAQARAACMDRTLAECSLPSRKDGKRLVGSGVSRQSLAGCSSMTTGCLAMIWLRLAAPTVEGGEAALGLGWQGVVRDARGLRPTSSSSPCSIPRSSQTQKARDVTCFGRRAESVAHLWALPDVRVSPRPRHSHGKAIHRACPQQQLAECMAVATEQYKACQTQQTYACNNAAAHQQFGSGMGQSAAGV